MSTIRKLAVQAMSLTVMVGTVGAAAAMAPPAYAASGAQPTVKVTNPGTGATSTYTIDYTTNSGGSLPGGVDGSSNVIMALAPNGTDFSNCSATITDNTNPADTGPALCRPGNSQDILHIYPQNPINANNSLTIAAYGVVNPTQANSSDTLQISTSTQSPVTSAPYAIKVLSVSRPSVQVHNNAPGATTTYTIGFTTSSGGSLPGSNYNHDDITAVAPNGTDFSGCNATITDNTNPADSADAGCYTGNNQNTLLIRPSNPIGDNNSLTIT
ncbi:MAG: hypothetical protein ACRDX8_14475, partial [Acidimicrobiales bacterium]